MQSHTRIIELLVSLCFRRSQKCVLQSDANVGNGTLAAHRIGSRDIGGAAVGVVCARSWTIAGILGD
jgi:hypothetical protein